MDKSAQGGREARLAKALRSNLRRRKPADSPVDAHAGPVDAEAAGESAPSQPSPKPVPKQD